ncbi:glycohydrolase toxin TNT-related protein [Microbacterium sp. BWT-B31]|uniref:glycohydrolase toxin TNT-related protein n=1 Tax=Microbacterium sp. BWT-B31 TaxID=3232072 RepID=UPI003527437A
MTERALRRGVYAYPDGEDGSTGGVRWPTNDGAVAGSGVHYDSTEALLRDCPEFARLDRIGLWGGDYLTVEGTPFEARGLTPGHRAMPYSAFDLTPPLPRGVQIEISVIDEALGYPGGGWQIRFFRTGADGRAVFLSIDELIDLEVLG